VARIERREDGVEVDESGTRAVSTRSAPRGICAISSAPIIPRVSSVSSEWSENDLAARERLVEVSGCTP
jgi:hypothetical protein